VKTITFTEKGLTEFIRAARKRVSAARSDEVYCAACDVRKPPHILGPWFGPDRSTYDEAQKDADEHNKLSDHDAFVLGPD